VQHIEDEATYGSTPTACRTWLPGRTPGFGRFTRGYGTGSELAQETLDPHQDCECDAAFDWYPNEVITPQFFPAGIVVGKRLETLERTGHRDPLAASPQMLGERPNALRSNLGRRVEVIRQDDSRVASLSQRAVLNGPRQLALPA